MKKSKKSSTKNASTKAEVRTGFVALAVVCFVIAAAGVVSFLLKTVGAEAPADYIHMAETSGIDYQVYLKPDNGVVNKPYLGMNETYTYDIVDRIVFTNSYTSQLSQATNVKYNYSATISFIARVARGNIISDSDPIIAEEVVETLWQYDADQPDGNSSLVERSEINLERFRDKYSSIKSSLDFTVSGEIRIDLVVKASDGASLNNEYKRSITIPISQSYFEIKLGGEDKKETDFNAPSRTTAEVLALVALGAGAIGAFAVMLFCIKKALSYKSWYREEIDALLSDYDDAIIATTTTVNPKHYKEHIAVESFKEMLQLATDIGEPIMYYETSKTADFYIPKEDILYTFVIRKTAKEPEEFKPRREIEAEEEKALAHGSDQKE